MILLSAASEKVDVRDRWKKKYNKQETAGGHWRNSVLLTKDRGRLQMSKQRERERGGGGAHVTVRMKYRKRCKQ